MKTRKGIMIMVFWVSSLLALYLLTTRTTKVLDIADPTKTPILSTPVKQLSQVVIDSVLEIVWYDTIWFNVAATSGGRPISMYLQGCYLDTNRCWLQLTPSECDTLYHVKEIREFVDVIEGIATFKTRIGTTGVSLRSSPVLTFMEK